MTTASDEGPTVCLSCGFNHEPSLPCLGTDGSVEEGLLKMLSKYKELGYWCCGQSLDTITALRARVGELEDGVTLVRRYFWCESRAEGRRIDAAAMKFLDANGGREIAPPSTEEGERLARELASDELTAWLLEDGDRCAGIVADAYSSWDVEQPWRDALKAEIKHRMGKGCRPPRTEEFP